jgi:uncharacterized cupredoxin-like copper-binding protein
MLQTPAERNPAFLAVLVVAIVALVLAAAALTAVLVRPGAGFGMVGAAYGPGGYGAGMMGGAGGGATSSQPGAPGFVAGTAAAPRAIRVVAGPGDAFSPSSISVARGETVTFVVTTAGPIVHEFMVGPADAVAADQAGTPEVADVGMMQTKSVTVTFDGPGPYAFACHQAGHFEAGMRGTITIVG